MNLGPGKEFDRIRAIFNSISELSPEAEGLGDDCALVPLGTTTLAVSIDASLEGVHFRTDWLDFKEIGFRAAGAALSDLAADGATPLGLLVSLGVPPRNGKNGADPAVEIMAGVATIANNVGARIDRKSTRLNSSHGYISYAVFCLKKKKKTTDNQHK